MRHIESPTNRRIAEAVRSLRDGALVPLEGRRAVLDGLDAGLRPSSAFFEVPAADPALVDRLEASGAELFEVTPRVIERLSDLPSSRGIVALSAPPARRLDEIRLGKHGLALLLDGLQDPSNVGAIVRSAEAFGAQGVLLTPGSANPFGARALRASAGSSFRLPVVTVGPAEAVAWARALGASIAGADARGGVPPEEARLSRPLVVVIGSEGHGISGSVAAALDARLTIPLACGVESLNAAAAAAVLLYALSPKTSASKR